MSDRARKLAPWIALALACVLAFALGRMTSQGTHEEAQEAAEGAIWTCSMHPQIRQGEPGQCPICGMDLVPVSEGAVSRDRVTLGERARVLARIRTTPVRRLEAGGAAVRLLGRVDYDETTLTSVTAWIGGRIDRLHVAATGVRVRRGQIVATLYSPEVYAAQQDLIAARRALDRLGGATALARSSAEAALEAARQRLRLLGVPEAELDRMAQASAPSREVAIRSPFAGTVIERVATEGTYVQTGAPLYRVADLSRLWVQLDAFERDLAQLTVGQSVELTVEALPGETFTGRLAFVDPVVDRQRRTARARVEVVNADGRLRPGMFVEASVRARTGESAQPLVIPASAPLFTGRRSLVYVEVPDADAPTYEARVVRLGPRVGELYPVVTGLAEGERVVTEGAFAIDADLQIRGGRSMMARGDDRLRGPRPPAARSHVPASGALAQAPDHAAALEVSEAFSAGLRTVIEPYLRMQARLADDDLAGAKEAAAALVRATDAFAPAEPDASAAWRPIGEQLRMHASRAADAASIEAARAEFEPLSRQIAQALRVLGNPMQVPLHLAFCPMAFDDRGAEWIQRSETIDNAYFGAAMRTCGSIRESVGPGEHLAEGAPR